jgi:hypothetical protein
MSTPTRRRLMRDFKRLQGDPPGKIKKKCLDEFFFLTKVILSYYSWCIRLDKILTTIVITIADY